MALILAFETSCDETGVGIYDSTSQRILANTLFSQVALHEAFGGVVPEIASRSQLEKIVPVLNQALDKAGVHLSDIEVIAVTNTPGLVGSLLVGICFAKSLAWAEQKKLIGINHLEGHIFSSFLRNDGTLNEVPFPHLALTASGGHTSLYLVRDFGQYELLLDTLDDAAGEAFDKVGKILGLGYPAGAKIERLAEQVNFADTMHYPRGKNAHKEMRFSFSGLKTAVLYSMVKAGAYELATGPIVENVTPDLQQHVASSLLVCIGDIFVNNVRLALQQYPEVQAVTFVGGVACNKYLKQRLQTVAHENAMAFFSPPPPFCTDNGGMIAFVAGYKAQQGKFSALTLDVPRN